MNYLAGDVDSGGPSLGWRRTVLLVESPGGPNPAATARHAQALETFCLRHGIRLSILNQPTFRPKLASSVSTPFQSPLLTGSFPSSPMGNSPDFGPHCLGRVEMPPKLSLDGVLASEREGSPAAWEVSGAVRALHEKLQGLPQVGIVHLALQNDSVGSILRWQNDVFLVAEPGETADRFLESAIQGLRQGRGRRGISAFSGLSSISDLVCRYRSFMVAGILHRYMGCQTQVMEDDQEVAAFMFRRTVPAAHLAPEDVRWMAGDWRDRIIIYTGKHSPATALTKSFLDSGAKAVVSPSINQPNSFISEDGGKFVIGDEEEEDYEEDGASASKETPPPPPSPGSDWDDSEPEPDEEEELAKFVCLFYDLLYRDGARVDAALQQALRSFARLKYSCHLPNTPLE